MSLGRSGEHDGVYPTSLSIRDGRRLKRLSTGDQTAMDARSTYKTTDGMLRWGAGRIGNEISKAFLEALMYYSLPRWTSNLRMN